MTALAIAPQKLTTRSRLTNGSRAFLAADGRTREARLLRDREEELAKPLGGLEALALADRAKVEAAALLSVRLEIVRSALASGAAGMSDEDLVRLTNGLSRAMAALDKLAATKARKTERRGVHAYLAAREAQPA